MRSFGTRSLGEQGLPDRRELAGYSPGVLDRLEQAGGGPIVSLRIGRLFTLVREIAEERSSLGAEP